MPLIRQIPLSRCNLPLLLGLEVHPAQVDPVKQEANRKLHHTCSPELFVKVVEWSGNYSLEVLVFLEILAIQQAPVRRKIIIIIM